MMRTLNIPYSRRSPLEARYWPADTHPELDEERVELSPAAAGDGAAELFEVLSAGGRVIDRFADRWEAVGALNRWPQAAMIAQAGRVVARKPVARKDGGP